MRSAGELFIVGFEGRAAPPELLAAIREERIAGVVLFARNLGSLEEIAALTASLHAAVPEGSPPLIVSIDQEGGRVQRVKAPLTVWPPMMGLSGLVCTSSTGAQSTLKPRA